MGLLSKSKPKKISLKISNGKYLNLAILASKMPLNVDPVQVDESTVFHPLGTKS